MTGFTTRIATLALTSAAMLTSFAGCFGDDDRDEPFFESYDYDDEGGQDQPVNQPPVARGLLERTVFLGGETVTLDGLASSDPEGDPITHEWGMTGKDRRSDRNVDDASGYVPASDPGTERL